MGTKLKSENGFEFSVYFGWPQSSFDYSKIETSLKAKKIAIKQNNWKATMVGGGVDKKSHDISLEVLNPKWRITIIR